MNLEETATWAYRCVVTETVGGSVNVDFAPQIGSEFQIVSYTIGPDDYAGNELLTVVWQDETPDTLAWFERYATLDNNRIFFSGIRAIPTSVVASTANSIGVPIDLVISNPDVLRFSVETLLAAETFTIAVRLRIKNHKPAVTVSGSGTPTTVVTYNKVIG